MRTEIYISIGLCGIIVLHDVVCQNEDFLCDAPWQKLYTGCYMFVKQTLYNWTDARNFCVDKGGNLFSVSSAKELDKIGPKIGQQITDLSLLEWWIGLRHSSDLQVWKWADNLTLNTAVIQWAVGHPKSHVCGAINYQDRIKDLNCTEVKPFVCEKDMTDDVPATTEITTTSPITTSEPPATTQSITNVAKQITQDVIYRFVCILFWVLKFSV